MDLKKAMKFVGRQIDDLEKQVYSFESILKPRYEADKAILEELRGQFLKMRSIEQKLARGEDPTIDEVYDAVPLQFR